MSAIGESCREVVATCDCIEAPRAPRLAPCAPPFELHLVPHLDLPPAMHSLVDVDELALEITEKATNAPNAPRMRPKAPPTFVDDLPDFELPEAFTEEEEFDLLDDFENDSCSDTESSLVLGGSFVRGLSDASTVLGEDIVQNSDFIPECSGKKISADDELHTEEHVGYKY
eukprot:CAMPEP_0169108146 /NCGR_PEP_ID=MMETSP1015-20121227/25265_1 /TAXON_ID=342587 /ORGANISM="Karlodinium micrum, Strain CCMP2283" /LENGTH=170 /DNA_ID=CAMNT_0009169735 /DNA_START=60 /DNA_END=572 /DNA_ORIENTATION=+